MKNYKVRIEVLYVDESEVEANSKEEAEKIALEGCDECFETIIDVSVDEIKEQE